MSYVTRRTTLNSRAISNSRTTLFSSAAKVYSFVREYHGYEWVISHYEWARPHVWLSHVTCMNESCHTHEWVMSHVWISHATHVSESCPIYRWVMWDINQWVMSNMDEWVMSHAWMSHVTHMNESYHTWMSHFIHIHESCHTYEWVMSHTWNWKKAKPHSKWKKAKPHSNVCCSVLQRVAAFCKEGSCVTQFTRMTLPHVWQDSCIFETWLCFVFWVKSHMRMS